MEKILKISILLFLPILWYLLMLSTPRFVWSIYNVGFALLLMFILLSLFSFPNNKYRYGGMGILTIIAGISIVFPKLNFYLIYMFSSIFFLSALSNLLNRKMPVYLEFMLIVFGVYHASLFLFGAPSWYITLILTPEFTGNADIVFQDYMLKIIIGIMIILLLLKQKRGRE